MQGKYKHAGGGNFPQILSIDCRSPGKCHPSIYLSTHPSSRALWVTGMPLPVPAVPNVKVPFQPARAASFIAGQRRDNLWSEGGSWRTCTQRWETLCLTCQGGGSLFSLLGCYQWRPLEQTPFSASNLATCAVDRRVPSQWLYLDVVISI